MSDLEKTVFLICPVREVTTEEYNFLQGYVSKLEAEGYKVHFPPRDTKQDDPTGGYEICKSNCEANRNAVEVHIYWKPKSKGSLFDIGVYFIQHIMDNKPFKLINREEIQAAVDKQREQGIPKSFEQVLLRLDDEYRAKGL